MRAKRKQGSNDVKKIKERMLARKREEYQDYINQVAQHAIDDEMHAAVIRAIASSDKAMSSLAKSDEAMANLARCDKAMDYLAKSDAAMANLAKCDGAVMKLFIMRVAKSDNVLAKLAQSDEAMMKILGPEMFQIWNAHRSKPAE